MICYYRIKTMSNICVRMQHILQKTGEDIDFLGGLAENGSVITSSAQISFFPIALSFYWFLLFW